MAKHQKHLSLWFVFGFLFILLLGGCTPNNSKSSATPPNIIFIMADDLGFGDLSSYGSSRIHTPHIDELAKEGMRFTQFYAGSAVCTPTRVSVLTGRSPLRYSVTKHFNDQEMYLPATMPTIPKALKKAGYVTKHVGKWHLGGLNETHVKDREHSMPGPLEHGFDEYLAMLEDPLYRKPAMLEKRLYKDGAKHLVRNDTIIPPIDAHWTDVKTREASDFIDESHQKGQAFFLNLWFDTPHAPYEAAPSEHLAPYKNRTAGQDLLYRSMVSHLDESVGRIVKQLKRLGIAENTLVVFTSDNGPAYLGSPGPFKGRKVDLHEGGIRVPGIAWWPGKIKANQVSNELMHTNDLFPTFCMAAGLDTEEYALDGVNVLSHLTDGTPIENRGFVFWQIAKYMHNGNYVVVSDKRPDPVVTEVVRKGPWKLLAMEGVAKELYHLSEDPYERWNLVKQYPRVANEMSEALQQWLNEPRLSVPYE